MDGVKEGYMEMGKKKKLGAGIRFKPYWAVLVEGSLHLYAHPSDPEPYKTFQLESTVLEPSASASSSVKDKEHTISLRIGDKPKTFAFHAKEDLGAWTVALKEAIGKKAASPPPRDEAALKLRKEGKGDALFRAKKSLSNKIASSGAGKQGMKKIVNEDTRKVIDSLLEIITHQSSAKKAADVEKALVKVMVKGYLQYDQGIISNQDLQPIDQSVRVAFNHLDKLYRYYGVRKASSMHDSFVKASELFRDATNKVIKLLEPHVRTENIILIRNSLEYISSVEFLMGVWDDQSIEEELFVLINSMNKYTQFES
eukprot:TRINITY_DN3320_c0_g1_i1.p1 TRINITY_DN3320_c0_g1~~TRINITY_DN3320_c0_g1_i1.p1  ORF type:complete len:312 (-),score=71.00 TRINITY_DN3320_c0_g1_i1:155-1090(-)